MIKAIYDKMSYCSLAQGHLHAVQYYNMKELGIITLAEEFIVKGSAVVIKSSHSDQQ